jgi:hypothetical protein
MDTNDLYAPPKAPLENVPDGTPTSFITLYWSGRGKLWKIYWLYGTACSWVIGITIGIFSRLSGISIRALMIGFLPYNFWVVVSVWRCAFNAESQTWGYVARVLVVIGQAQLLFHIFTGYSMLFALLRSQHQ